MVHTRLIRLILGLLFVMNGIRDSYAHAHAHEDWMNKKELVMTRDNVVSAKRELLDGFTTTKTRKMGLGGRKMVVYKVLRKEIEKDQGVHGVASEDISGNDQNNALEKTLKSASLGPPRSDESVHLSSTSPKHSQESKALPTKASLASPSRSANNLLSDQEPQGSTAPPKGEMQRLLKATREIVNLMTKDYKGMDKPRRKPPINNHVPIH